MQIQSHDMFAAERQTCDEWYRAIATPKQPVVALFELTCLPDDPVRRHNRHFCRRYATISAAKRAFHYWQVRKGVHTAAYLHRENDLNVEFAEIIWRGCGD